MSPESALLYLHIPKTAGSAMSDLFTSHFSPERCYNIKPPDYAGSEAALRALPAEAKARIDHVYGHFAFGLHDALPQPSRYYTVLREPIDRVVSLYYFIRASANHPRHEQVASMSLVEFALSGIHPEIENCQTKMLSGRASTHFMTGWNPCDEVDLARAKEHLDLNFIACGLFEDLPRSLYLLCKAVGWKYLPLRQKNVTKHRRNIHELSDEERVVLESINRYDIQLYEYASRRHRASFDGLGWLDRIRWLAILGMFNRIF